MRMPAFPVTIFLSAAPSFASSNSKDLSHSAMASKVWPGWSTARIHLQPASGRPEVAHTSDSKASFQASICAAFGHEPTESFSASLYLSYCLSFFFFFFFLLLVPPGDRDLDEELLELLELLEGGPPPPPGTRVLGIPMPADWPCMLNCTGGLVCGRRPGGSPRWRS